jgi:hypothetical protein
MANDWVEDAFDDDLRIANEEEAALLPAVAVLPKFMLSPEPGFRSTMSIAKASAPK